MNQKKKPTLKQPCIRECCLNDDDICVGCFRTLDDMKVWHRSTDDEKLAILKVANGRRAVMKEGSRG